MDTPKQGQVTTFVWRNRCGYAAVITYVLYIKRPSSLLSSANAYNVILYYNIYQRPLSPAPLGSRRVSPGVWTRDCPATSSRPAAIRSLFISYNIRRVWYNIMSNVTGACALTHHPFHSSRSRAVSDWRLQTPIQGRLLFTVYTLYLICIIQPFFFIVLSVRPAAIVFLSCMQHWSREYII